MDVLPQLWGWGILGLTALLMFVMSYWIYTRTRVNDSESFLVASRGVSWGLIAASIAATELWAGSLLASAEGVFNWGLSGIWIYALPTGISFTVFALVARRARYLVPHGITVGSWVKERFGSSTHVIFILVALYIMFVFTMFQVIGGAILFSSMFGINYTTASIIIAVVFVGYYLIAGLWSSLVTSFIQYFVVVLILLGIVPWVYYTLGGPGAIFDMIAKNVTEPQQLNLFRSDAILNYFLMTLGGWGVIATMSNYAWQRAYAVEEKHVTKALLVGGWSWVPLALVSSTMGAVGIGLGLKLKLATDVFPAVVSAVLPVGASIFLAVALLFAIYSTGTAYIGGFTALVTSDLYQDYIKKTPGLASLKFVRIVSVIFGLLVTVAVVSLQKVSLLQVMLTTGVFISAPFFPIVLGLYWKKTSMLGANIATVAALVVTTYLLLFSQAPLWLIYVLSYVISLSLVYIITMLKPDNFDFEKMRQGRLAGK